MAEQEQRHLAAFDKLIAERQFNLQFLNTGIDALALIVFGAGLAIGILPGEGKLTLTFTGLEAMRRRVEERHEDETARKKFMQALRRDPGNPTVLNNLKLLDASVRYVERDPGVAPK